MSSQKGEQQTSSIIRNKPSKAQLKKPGSLFSSLISSPRCKYQIPDGKNLCIGESSDEQANSPKELSPTLQKSMSFENKNKKQLQWSPNGDCKMILLAHGGSQNKDQAPATTTKEEETI